MEYSKARAILDNIDDELIEETAQFSARPAKRPSIKKLIIAAAACFLLSLGAVSFAGNLFALRYLPFSEAVSQADGVLKNKDLFRFDGIVPKLPLTTASPHKFELAYRQSSARSDLRLIASVQFPGLDIDSTAADGNVFYDYPESSFFTNGHEAIRVEGNTGYIRLLHGATLEYLDDAQREALILNGSTALSVFDPSELFPAERIISIHSGEKVEPSLAYELPGGEVKVVDAMNAAQAYLDNVFAPLEDGVFSYNIRKVYVRKVSEGVYGYEFIGERLYDGIPIDTTPLYKFDGPDFGGEGYYAENGDWLEIWMLDGESIDFFYTPARRTVKNVADGYDKILSLDSAVNILRDGLPYPDFFDVLSVELLYINGYYADSYLTAYTDEEAEKLLDYPRSPRLVWAVLIDIPTVRPGTADYPHDPHYSLFVDAETGEIIGYYEEGSEYVY